MISNNRKKIKNIVLYVLSVILFIALIYFTFWKNYLEDIVMFAINGKQEKDIVEVIKINDIEVPFDKSTKTFYYPVNAEDEEKNIKFDIEIKSKDKVRYVIGDQEFYEKATITTTINFKTPLEIYSSNNFIYNKYYIKFTNLPIINISNNISKVSNEYTYGNVNIIDPKYKENESEYTLNSDIKIRTRGTSGSYQKKKSYRLKFIDNNNNKNLSLLGMRNDSDWILDSLYAENSYIRNGMAYDLWNLINADINEEYRVKLNWKLVEVFSNNEYVGLYVLKEPIDEDTLNLTKTSNSNSGILLKGIDHDMADFSEENIKSIKGNTYYGFEIKHPKDLKDNSLYWYKILSKMKDYYSGNVTDEVIENTFYEDNLVNYSLFLLALQAVDNYEPKNTYFSLKDFNEDTKVLLTPWDLDLTFGIQWDEIEGPKKYYDKVEIIDEINVGNSAKYVEKIKSRWKYLRDKVFNEVVINQLIDNYYEELTLSDAGKRNYDKWEKDTNVYTELNEIKEWCAKRFLVVDKYIDEL